VIDIESAFAPTLPQVFER